MCVCTRVRTSWHVRTCQKEALECMKENIVLLRTLGGKLHHGVLITPINAALWKRLPDDAIAKRVFLDFVSISSELRLKLAI